MKSWKTPLRIAGLIVLLNMVPFVRGCDDVEGLHETTGFPVPYFTYSTSSFDLSTFHLPFLGINIAVLCVVIGLLMVARSKVITVLAGWRFLLAVVALAILLKFSNVFVFIPLMLICVGLAEVFSNINMELTIDVLARLLFLPLLTVCYFIEREERKRFEQENA